MSAQRNGFTTRLRMLSLLEKWHPVTSDFGLIQAPMPRLLSEFENWHRSIGIEYLRTQVSSSLADAFESLLPLWNSMMRQLFVATRSDWVTCFQKAFKVQIHSLQCLI